MELLHNRQFKKRKSTTYFNEYNRMETTTKKDLKDFRGISSGIGTSFSDNLVVDFRNELDFKGRILGKILSLTKVNKIFDAQLRTTKNHLDNFVKNQAIVYQNNKNAQNLINKYKFENSTDFGCVQLFEYLNKKYSCSYLMILNYFLSLNILILKLLKVFLKLEEVLELTYIF